MNKIKITSKPERMPFPTIEIDGNEIGVTHFVVRWDVGEPAKLNLEMFLKDAEIDLEGNLSIKGVPLNDEIGKAIYESLKDKYAEKLNIKIPARISLGATDNEH